MQDRTSANFEEVLLQRTAGPYIRVKLDRLSQGGMSIHVCSASNSDRIDASQQTVPTCQSRPNAFRNHI